jgi:hypothetical protein
MSSIRKSPVDSSQRQEAHQAARILINQHSERLEYMLVDAGLATDWLRELCSRMGVPFLEVMNASPTINTTPSQFSPPLSPPNSRHPSSASTVPSSSASNRSSPNTGSLRIVAHINSEQEGLKAKSAADSCCLIRVDTVYNRFQLTTQRLPQPVLVYCEGKPQESCEKVSFRWAWNKDDMRESRLQMTTFYLVPELHKIEVLLGDLEPQEYPLHNDAGLFSLCGKAISFTD